MIINEMFNRGSEEEIRNTINNLEVIGCVDKFVSYIEEYENDTDEVIDRLERIYMGRLSANVTSLVCDIYMQRHSDKSKDELLEELSNWYVDGIYGIEDQISNNGLRDVMGDFTDSDSYEYIKSYMTKTLDKYIEQTLLTETEDRIVNLEYRIGSYEETIKQTQRELEYAMKLLKEAKGDK